MSPQISPQPGIIHRNNFDVLRILLAAMVVITHSWLLSGAGETDPLFRLTGGQTTLSYLGVRGFFAISGYLVYQSLLRSSPGGYFAKRALRIFPGLIVMLVLVAFVIGPLFSAEPAAAYLGSPLPLRYVLSELRIIPSGRTEALPGLFTANPSGPVVNGSLWTIWFEILFYIALAVLFFLKRWPKLLTRLTALGWAALFVLFCAFHRALDPVVFPFTGMSAEVPADLLLYFAAGAAAAATGILGKKNMKSVFLFAGMALLLGSLWAGGFFFLRYLAWPMIILGFGSMLTPPLPQIRRLGEPSYGMYIWAYPVQQLLVQELHPSAGVLSLLTLLIVVPLGYASWHLVERRALKRNKQRGISNRE